MRFIYSAIVLVLAIPASAQTLSERLDKLEASQLATQAALQENTKAVNSLAVVVTRLESQLADLKADNERLAAKLDAMAKTQKVTFQTSASGGWSETTATMPQPAAVQAPMYMSLGVGACAGGSCGVPRGLFGRRR